MSLKISKFLYRFLLGVYAYFLIHFIVPILVLLGSLSFFLNILLGIGVILLEGYIFLWKIPWLLYKGTGFKKKYYPILPITSLISFVLLFPKFVNLVALRFVRGRSSWRWSVPFAPKSGIVDVGCWARKIPE